VMSTQMNHNGDIYSLNPVASINIVFVVEFSSDVSLARIIWSGLLLASDFCAAGDEPRYSRQPYWNDFF